MRIDSGRTFYQILGVHRTDEQDKVRASYHGMLDRLYPPDAIGRALPPDVASRVDRAFAKLSQAFGVLASYTRRREYDSALLSVVQKEPAQSNQHAASKPEQSNDKTSARQVAQQPQRNEPSAAGSITQNPRANSIPAGGQASRESTKANSSNNRRRCGRMNLGIPVRVAGHDQQNGKWSEMGETIDVSRTGARLHLRRRVKQGVVLFLTLPLPAKLRAHGFSEQGYNVYALVRTVDPPVKGVRAVGVEFLGERPPAGFFEKPWAIYRAKRAGTVERRRHRRDERTEAVNVEYLDEHGQLIARDEAKSENVGNNGIRIVGTSAPPEFDSVSLTCPKLNFEAAAVLRDRFRGKDGLERLCLQLVDKSWPSH